MIPARKGGWFSHAFSSWFAAHAEGRLRGAFSEVRVRGLPAMREAVAGGPVLVVSNHTAWWDPLVSIVLSYRLLGTDGYAMMDAANLVKLPFFARVGAFGVALDDPADGARAIRYALKLLDRPGRLVWVFAQGGEVPVTARPLVFRAGSAEIARIARAATVVPLGLRYEHGKQPAPVLWMSIGASIGERLPAIADRKADPEVVRRAQESAVTRELDRIDRAIVEGHDEGFEVLFRRPEGPGSRVAQALLAWATRPRARI